MRLFGIFLSTGFALASLCGGQTTPDLDFESLQAHRYENGFVLNWNPSTQKLSLYASAEKPEYSIPSARADRRSYDAWAVDTDGTLARSYHDKSEGRVELLSNTGGVTGTIDTGSYEPSLIAFAPDHTFWTVGYQFNYWRPTGDSEDFNVVRHYARTGEKLAEALPWSQIAGDCNAYCALSPSMTRKSLFVTSDRIGFISHDARPGRGIPKWVELTTVGVLLGKYALGSHPDIAIEPAAMASSGDVYARIYEDLKLKGYAVLDRSTLVWSKVSGYPRGSLTGSDADSLVFSELVGSWTVLHSAPITSIKVKKTDPPVLSAAYESN